MKRAIIITIFFSFSSAIFSQIIADHSVVDKFDQIPSYYINEVKKMYVAFYGSLIQVHMIMGWNCWRH